MTYIIDIAALVLSALCVCMSIKIYFTLKASPLLWLTAATVYIFLLRAWQIADDYFCMPEYFSATAVGFYALFFVALLMLYKVIRKYLK
jgi:hypothetical protein